MRKINVQTTPAEYPTFNNGEICNMLEKHKGNSTDSTGDVPTGKGSTG